MLINAAYGAIYAPVVKIVVIFLDLSSLNKFQIVVINLPIFNIYPNIPLCEMKKSFLIV